MLGPVELGCIEQRGKELFRADLIDALNGEALECDGSGDNYEVLADLPKLDWVIVGGESGPKARPMHPDWARSLRDQCAAAGVPFLFKQWGNHRPTSDCEHGEYMMRATKAEAGRLLDGLQHDGFPA